MNPLFSRERFSEHTNEAFEEADATHSHTQGPAQGHTQGPAQGPEVPSTTSFASNHMFMMLYTSIWSWITRWLSSLSPEMGDGWLYGLSFGFALLTGVFSNIALYRQWGWLALGPYGAAVILSLGLHRYRLNHRRNPATNLEAGIGDLNITADSDAPTRTSPKSSIGVGRIWIFLFVLIGATLMPLGLEVTWFSQGHASTHVQPEVVVIAKAGSQTVHGKDPYRTVTNPKGQVVLSSPGLPVYENFFPYLPLMTVFGIPSSTDAPGQLTDPRIFFSLVTIFITLLALGIYKGDRDKKMRTLQVLTVLPVAALPLATGGDDMPIVAFLLLAMVLAQRRYPGMSGLVLGIVCSMKFTAWPLAALALFAARDKQDRRRPIRMLLGMVVVGVPVLVPFILKGPWAFFENVVLFPLGLAGVTSPAASPLPGHILITLFPWLHRALAVCAGLGIVGVLGIYLLRQRPQSVAKICLVGAWVATAAIMLAPATRVGYLLYPINFFVWAYLFTTSRQGVKEVAPAACVTSEATMSLTSSQSIRVSEN